MKNRSTTVRRVRGFTLVEALVALLALSIGLLGVAALQMTGLRNNLSASFRSQATYLAYDIVDRMRANRNNASAYNIPYGAVSGTGTIAATDAAAWKANLSTTLPSGEGKVVVTTTGDLSVVEVTIKWDESRSGEAEDAAPIEFVTRSII